MKIFRYFLGFSFISITLFVLLIRPVLGSAQLDYDNGEYFNEQTTMFQYDQQGNVVIDRDNYNFMEQGQILFDTVVIEDENGNAIGTRKELKLITDFNNLISPFTEVGNVVMDFFGVSTPNEIIDPDLYDYIIYEEGHEGQESHILYDLRNVYEQFNGIQTDIWKNGAQTYTLVNNTLRYYFESGTYWKMTSLIITFNYEKMTENELLEYLQEHYPDYLN